ncbi:DUF262 domain-containing protein [Mesorhizobium sp. M2D.F.Ca.ET.223.01.1.1]|uniref:DUF262 domain-containing protein n=1 Tax=Mesorhizobium sp. M2D.F.Ca.ET.223.01.1.1 TaxID=2563940 RepID=UPI0010930D99|nr:DUF262 domain-containing protein [Mesorhizobium sp. M2D.F.Ca.ET.223.01.1.1]TGP86408.1 DUF262 domain-containing protein [bacterium M00.F.Ca.ET.221.01.1.1]TGR88750.1 DUF262 domain-containing protein [Mesorhizobium sp. M2D.F.Ca.ET.223.01.1.1]
MSRHTIEASEKPILDIFCDKYLFRIPSYQRPYAWTTDQASELLDDIMTACGDTANVGDASPYFLGSVVLIKDPQKPDADVVDGQQRLTTLTILLSVLRDLSDQKIATAIHNYVCQTGDPIKGTSDVFRLTPRERDVDFFREIIQNEGGTSSLPDARQFKDARSRMVENATFLRDRLKDLSDDQRRRLTMYIAQRCYLVIVAASDQDSAFRIFSVLNSRGLDLSPADVLKAEIIGALPVDKQEPYTQKWEDLEDELGRARFAELFGHIRTIHRKQKMQGTLIAEFREFVPTRKEPAKFIDAELTPYADAYEEITDRAFSSFKNADEVNRQLTHLSRLDNFDWQPPAMEVIARRREDPDFILRFLSDLERLAYGLFLMRSDPSERIRRYARLLSSIQSSDDLFADKSPLQLSDDEKKEVRKALGGDIYTVTRIRLPLLLRLDELLSGGSAVYNSPIISVEHVLPQNPAVGGQWLVDFPSEDDRQKWVHKLANLVLLTRRKNSQASNYEFVDKKERYFSTKAGVSNFALTSKVLTESVWTPEILRKRQSELIGAIEKLWRLV